MSSLSSSTSVGKRPLSSSQASDSSQGAVASTVPGFPSGRRTPVGRAIGRRVAAAPAQSRASGRDTAHRSSAPMGRRRTDARSAASRSAVAPASAVAATASSAPKQYSVILNRNLTNVSDLDTRVIGWIFEALGRRTNVEVEIKLGRIVSNDSVIGANGREVLTRMGKKLGLGTRVVLESPSAVGSRFVSGVSMAAFTTLNLALNEWAKTSKGKVSVQNDSTLDKTYKSGTRVSLRPNGTVKQCLVKERLADLNVICPRETWDMRISASIENESPPPSASDLLVCVRTKNRISYIFDDVFRVDITNASTFQRANCGFDLTKKDFIDSCFLAMRSGKSPHSAKCSYEVEVEICDPLFLATQRELFQAVRVGRNRRSVDALPFQRLCRQLLANALNLNVKIKTRT